MYSITSLTIEEINTLSVLLSSEYGTANFRNNHKSGLSDYERKVRKDYFDLISELRLKLIFNIKKEKDV